jgi:hypothetical protein
LNANFLLDEENFKTFVKELDVVSSILPIDFVREIYDFNVPDGGDIDLEHKVSVNTVDILQDHIAHGQGDSHGIRSLLPGVAGLFS